ncbi:unnamed protein product, partial [Urochloa humidicola]
SSPPRHLWIASVGVDGSRTREGEAGRREVAARHIFDGHYRDGDRLLLAVRLGNIICLWGASRDKVTKVCDFGEDDDVSFMGWAQPGIHLTAGTKQGKVQEPHMCCLEDSRRRCSTVMHLDFF